MTENAYYQPLRRNGSMYNFPDCATAERNHVGNYTDFVTGDSLRDWASTGNESAVWLYDENFQLRRYGELIPAIRFLWPSQSWLSTRRRFGTPMLQKGLAWYEWQELYPDKLQTPLTIGYSNVATHNQFVLFEEKKVFNSTAMVIKPKLSDSCRRNVHLRIKEESVSALMVECWTERPNCLIRTLFSALNAATRIKKAVLVHTPPVVIADRWVSR